MALLALKELILGGFDNKQMVFVIFIGLTKAFDHINRNVLLHKLEAYRVHGTSASFINSYLLHRPQSISHDSSFLTMHDTNTGVPRGSILGPLLFIAYINDIFNISHSATFVTYADYTSMFLNGTNLDRIIATANTTISLLKLWVENNFKN